MWANIGRTLLFYSWLFIGITLVHFSSITTWERKRNRYRRSYMWHRFLSDWSIIIEGAHVNVISLKHLSKAHTCIEEIEFLLILLHTPINLAQSLNVMATHDPLANWLFWKSVVPRFFPLTSMSLQYTVMIVKVNRRNQWDLWRTPEFDTTGSVPSDFRGAISQQQNTFPYLGQPDWKIFSLFYRYALVK